MTDRSIEARDQRLRREKENAREKESNLEQEQEQEILAAGVESSAANGVIDISDFKQADQDLLPLQAANKEWQHFYAVVSELVKDMR